MEKPKKPENPVESKVAESAARPDPEVPEKPRRRRFSAEYKLQILREAEVCGEGELGALLRREGLYSSHLSVWQKPTPVSPRWLEGTSGEGSVIIRPTVVAPR